MRLTAGYRENQAYQIADRHGHGHGHVGARERLEENGRVTWVREKLGSESTDSHVQMFVP